jgi:ribosomal protein L18
MPKTTKKGAARQDELPSTLKRSPKKAQRTFAKVHDAAAEQYGAAEGGANTSKQYRTAEGVDANASKKHLMDVAKRLDIHGRSSMKKGELVDVIMKANRRESASSREADRLGGSR